MKITLKNIKHLKTLSEETEAFTADLYIDGRPVSGQPRTEGMEVIPTIFLMREREKLSLRQRNTVNLSQRSQPS
jgi:hypothetical protein